MWDKLKKENAIFLLIDFQESFFKILDQKVVANVRNNILATIKMFKMMNIPMIGTEQYSKGLGKTDSKVLNNWSGPNFIDKTTFSCLKSEKFMNAFDLLDKNIVIIAGFETHICVLQTVIDLINKNYTVIVLSDAVLSTSKLKWKNGLDLIEKTGAWVASMESIIFYLLEKAKGDEFKYFSKLLKEMQN